MSAEIVEDKSAAPAAATPKFNRKKLMIIGAGVAALVLGGGGGAYFLFSGSSANASAEESSHGAGGTSGKPGAHGESGERDSDHLVDIPPMVVNLRSPDGGTRFLKLHLMLVPGANGTVEGLKNQLPLILDAYQPFLRELRPEDLAGSAAVFRLKEELLLRTINVAGQGSVQEILIEDLVQQ